MKHYNKKKGIITRECSACGGDLGDRYGKQRYCKSCHAAFMRATRPKHSDLKPDAKLKANARAYANEYMRRGKLVKKPCEQCGNPDSQKHHEDYNKPLEVIWLCRKCHLEKHSKRLEISSVVG